jgi:hypothetical protein
LRRTRRERREGREREERKARERGNTRIENGNAKDRERKMKVGYVLSGT